MAEEVVRRYAEIASTPEEADFILLRLSTPWTPAETEVPFGRNFHHGDLDFKGEVKDAILRLLAVRPAIVVIELDRPAVIPEISAASTALLGDFGRPGWMGIRSKKKRTETNKGLPQGSSTPNSSVS
jgi:beta-glucosidase